MPPPQPPSTPVPQPAGSGRGDPAGCSHGGAADGGHGGAGELLLGVDIGTSRCKAAVVSLDGAELAHGAVPIPWRVVPTGAEIDPGALVDAALDAVELALAGAPDGRVLALGVTSMAETCALLGPDGEPVAPAIAWHDQRGREEAERMAEALGADRFAVRSGLPPSPLCTLAKYRWLRDHSAAALGGTRLLSVAEWVVHRLGGEQLAELSLASRTGMLDREAADWSAEALAWAEAPAGLLPPLVQAGTPYGKAARQGRLDGAALTVAGHDHLCASVGAGVVAAGELFDSCGTAEALVQAVPPPLDADQVRAGLAGHVTAGWHVLPGLQVLLGAQRAGLALQRVLDLLGVWPEDRERLEREGVAAPVGAEGLVLEHADTERAVISGIGRHPSPGLLWRAAAEAVTRRSAELIATIESIAGPARRIAVAGGWSRSPTLRAAKAERLGHLDYPAVIEAGARGAALLAGCAAGVYAGPTAVPRPHAAAAGASSPGAGATAGEAPPAFPSASPGAGAHPISHTEREPG
jgi:sugar (pentulose or hexulose) kinase